MSAHPTRMTHGWAPSLREQRLRYGACRDIGERLVLLSDILDWTWMSSLLRKATPDSARMDVKRTRLARAMRLLVHLQKKRHPIPTYLRRIAALYALGRTTAEIQAQLGLSAATLHVYIVRARRHGLLRPHHCKWCGEEHACDRACAPKKEDRDG